MSIAKTFVMLAVLLNVAAAFAAEPGATSPSTDTNPNRCKNYENTKMCTECYVYKGVQYCYTYDCSNTNSPACAAGTSYNGSIIDNISFNHIHTALDLSPLGGAKSGCKTCGGSTQDNQFVPTLALQRIHRFRDITEQGSFGPGVFQNHDISLSIMQNGAANRVRVFDPNYFNPLLLDDGLNFRGNALYV